MKYYLKPTQYITKRMHVGSDGTQYPIGTECTVYRTFENPTVLVLTFNDEKVLELRETYAEGLESFSSDIQIIEDIHFFNDLEAAVEYEKENKRS